MRAIMRILAPALLMLLWSQNAIAQQVMDGTGVRLSRVVLEKALRLVSSEMKDPYSTQFQNLYKSAQGDKYVCGEVNAKNTYGAYVGFTLFVADLDSSQVEFAPDTSSIPRDINLTTQQDYEDLKEKVRVYKKAIEVCNIPKDGESK